MSIVKKHRALIFILVVFIELFIIIYLILTFKDNPESSVSGVNTATSIQNEGKLKYYFEPKPNSKGNNKQPSFLKEIPVYTINSDTLNERKDYSIHKNNDTYRILTLGDSFTYGLFVNTRDNYPEQLEDILNSWNCTNISNFEVINLGHVGEDIVYMEERFRKRGIKYNPDLIIMLLKDDDIYQSSEMIYKWLEENPDINSPTEDKWIRAIDEINQKIGEENIMKDEMNSLQNIRNTFSRDMLVLGINSFLDRGNIHIEEFIKKNTRTFFHIAPDEMLKKEYQFPDMHPTSQGYKIMVEDLSKYLDKNIITCS